MVRSIVFLERGKNCYNMIFQLYIIIMTCRLEDILQAPAEEHSNIAKEHNEEVGELGNCLAPFSYAQI